MGNNAGASGRKRSKGQALAFLCLVIAFAVPLQWLLVIESGPPELVYGLLMWSVGLAAIIVLRTGKVELADLGWWWGNPKYHIIAIALPAAYGLGAYWLASLFGLARFADVQLLNGFRDGTGFGDWGIASGTVVAILVVGTGAAIPAYARALGEEVGWRGFLTPRLTHAMGFIGGTLLTGCIWAAWHVPILWFGGYNSGGPLALEIASFAIMVIAISGPFAWLRLESKSLWPPATLHAAHNVIIQVLLDPLSIRGETTITIVGEFGVALASFAALISLPFWILGARNPQIVGDREE